MNRVCREAAEDAATLARTPAPVGPSQAPGESDEDAIWRTIEEEHRAYWSRDAAYDMAFHLAEQHEMLWGWQAGTGVTIRRNWDELEQSIRDGVSVNGSSRNPIPSSRCGPGGTTDRSVFAATSPG